MSLVRGKSVFLNVDLRRAGSPAFRLFPFQQNSRGCPILAFFARVGKMNPKGCKASLGAEGNSLRLWMRLLPLCFLEFTCHDTIVCLFRHDDVFLQEHSSAGVGGGKESFLAAKFFDSKSSNCSQKTREV